MSKNTSSNRKKSINWKLTEMSYLGPLDKPRKKGIKRTEDTFRIVLNTHCLKAIQNYQANTHCSNHCSAIDNDVRTMVCFSPLATWPSPGSSLRGLSSHPSTHPTFVKYLPYASHASHGCLLRTSRWKTWCLLQECKYADNHKRMCYEKCRHRTPGDTKDKWHLSISSTSSNNWPEY